MLSDDKQLPLLLGAAGALLFARIVLLPLLNWQNDLAAENQRLTKQLVKAELRITNTPDMVKRQATIAEILNSSEASLARGENRSKLTQQQALEQLFKDAKLTLRSFNWALEETLPEGHGRLRAEANLAGSLPSFLQGFYALATRIPHTNTINIDLRVNRREQQLTGRGLNGTILIDVITKDAK